MSIINKAIISKSLSKSLHNIKNDALGKCSNYTIINLYS